MWESRGQGVGVGQAGGSSGGVVVGCGWGLDLLAGVIHGRPIKQRGHGGGGGFRVAHPTRPPPQALLPTLLCPPPGF